MVGMADKERFLCPGCGKMKCITLMNPKMAEQGKTICQKCYQVGKGDVTVQDNPSLRKVKCRMCEEWFISFNNKMFCKNCRPKVKRMTR